MARPPKQGQGTDRHGKTRSPSARLARRTDLTTVARMIRLHLHGIVGWATWQINNARLEGTNNKVRLLGHPSFGLHSADALMALVYLCCGGLDVSPFH